MESQIKVLSAALVAVAGAALAPAAGDAALPRDIALPIPGAPYVRVMPGCVWGIGSTHLTITRKVGQAFNLVNLDTKRHELVQTAGTAGPLPSGIGGRKAVALLWRNPTTVVLTTCSGRMSLTVKVRPRPSR